MHRNYIWVIVVILLLAGGILLLNKGGSSNQTPSNQNTENTTNSNSNDSAATSNTDNSNSNNTVNVDLSGTVSTSAKTVTVTYTDSGFSPKSVDVGAGDTVVFKNESSGDMWVASAVHPTHTAYSGTSLQQHCPADSETAFDECSGTAPGTSWSFTFDKAGTWGYHDHLHANHTGSVTVK